MDVDWPPRVSLEKDASLWRRILDAVKDRRWLLLALVLGIGAGAVAALMHDSGAEQAENAEPALLDETDAAGTVKREAALAGRADGAALAPEVNEFADETDVDVLLRKAYWHTTREMASARLRELLREDPAKVGELLDLVRPEHDKPGRLRHYELELIGTYLAELGAPALREVQARLDDKDETYQMRMASVLAPFGAAAAPAVPRLMELMRAVPEDPRDKMTAHYVTVLGRIGPPAKALLPDLDRWLEEGLTQVVEIATARSIVLIGGADELVFRRALDVIGTEAWERQRRAMATAIGQLGKRAAPMIDGLLELATFEDSSNVAGTAVNLLGQIGIPDPRVIAKLEKDLTACTDVASFGGSWAFALSCLGAPGKAALLRALENRHPRAWGTATRHLKRAGLSDKQIWVRLEPALTQGEDARTWRTWRAIHSFTEAEGRVPEAAAVKHAPALMSSGERDERLVGLSLLLYADARGVTWRSTAQAVLRDPSLDEELRISVAETLAVTAGVNTRKALEGVRVLLTQKPNHRGAYGLLRHFAQEHPRPVLEQWATGVAADVVDWNLLRRLLTVFRPEVGSGSDLVAPKAIRDALDKHDPVREG